jgi:hypothetical protein
LRPRRSPVEGRNNKRLERVLARLRKGKPFNAARAWACWAREA